MEIGTLSLSLSPDRTTVLVVNIDPSLPKERDERLEYYHQRATSLHVCSLRHGWGYRQQTDGAAMASISGESTPRNTRGTFVFPGRLSQNHISLFVTTLQVLKSSAQWLQSQGHTSTGTGHNFLPGFISNCCLHFICRDHLVAFVVVGERNDLRYSRASNLGLQASKWATGTLVFSLCSCARVPVAQSWLDLNSFLSPTTKNRQLDTAASLHVKLFYCRIVILHLPALCQPIRIEKFCNLIG